MGIRLSLHRQAKKLIRYEKNNHISTNGYHPINRASQASAKPESKVHFQIYPSMPRQWEQKRLMPWVRN